MLYDLILLGVVHVEHEVGSRPIGKASPVVAGAEMPLSGIAGQVSRRLQIVGHQLDMRTELHLVAAGSLLMVRHRSVRVRIQA